MAKYKPTPQNEYEAARQEWNERFGEYVNGARQWRITAFAALGLSAIGFGFGLWQSTKTKLIPYIVQVDEIGAVAYSGPVPSTTQTDPRIIKASLITFISNLRGVTSDPILQRQRINVLYTYLSKSDPATVRINDYFSKDGGDPFSRAKEGLVSVQVTNITPLLSEKTWQVDWIETSYATTGEKTGEKRFKANISITISPPQDEAIIRINPLGLFITNIEWSQTI
jgi:type IV secretion system protein VirB5